MTTDMTARPRSATARQTRGVAYLRAASSLQVGGVSVARQRRRCGELAAAENIVLVEEFVDRGVSGRAIDRAGLRWMLERISEGDISHVVIERLDGLTRSLPTATVLIDHFRRHGVKIVYKDTVTDVAVIVDFKELKERAS